ncbi:MAG TPA: hypothetical protein VGM29_14060 [Polyangiaceae bacterium]
MRLHPRVGRYRRLLAGVLLAGCSNTLEVGRDFAAGAGTGGVGASGGSFNLGGTSGNVGVAGATSAACQVTTCQGKTYACGDCVDNDGDGRIDADDVECTGPCDNTEDSYFGGIPGQNNAPCRQDCYFDQDSGSGNDRCDWSQTCDPLSLAPSYPPSGDAQCAYDPTATIPGGLGTCASLALAQDPVCISTCLPLTPNGCDCFGCCELPAGSGSFVWLGSTEQGAGSCTQETLADPAACHPCTPVKSCFNACEPCERCVGRPTPAPSCTPTSARCEVAGTECGDPGDPGCASGYYCITGCCQAVPK